MLVSRELFCMSSCREPSLTTSGGRDGDGVAAAAAAAGDPKCMLFSYCSPPRRSSPHVPPAPPSPARLPWLHLEVAYPLREVRHEQPLDQLSGRPVHVPRELELALQDFLVDAERLLIVEGWVARHHFVDQDPQRPPVHRLTVPLGQDDLGGEILGCPAKCPRAVRNLPTRVMAGSSAACESLCR